MERADRVLLVLDDAVAVIPEDILKHLAPNLPCTVIRNKIDLTDCAPGLANKSGGVEIALSAKTGAGLDVLRRHLKECMGFQTTGEGTFTARRRHLDAIRRAQEHIIRGRAQLKESRAGEKRYRDVPVADLRMELLAEELRLAQQALGEITGAFTTEDLLGRIFSSFCLGK